MASKKNPPQAVVEETIIQRSMEDVLHASMLPYAEYVILERALPRVEDGLKPVQRRILYTMHELGITPDKPHRKSARIVGDCLGKFHPHGDSSVYEAMVRMAQDFMMSAPLVDGHGNFGSIDGDPAAALRYTEARMAPLALELLRDIQKDTVPFRLNFDDTLTEPDMLPGRFPNLLVNGASGIAVGLATNIPPHNLKEAIDAVIAQLENPAITTDELMAHMPCPDFPTGGLLYGGQELKKAYETGRGRLVLRAKVHFEDAPAGRKLIVITEIPYQVNKANMLEKILKLSEEKKGPLLSIYDIRDESDRTGMRAVIELRKDCDPGRVLQYLYKYSDLQTTFGVNMMAIAEAKPMLLSLKEAISYYINHQKRVVTRRTEYELKQAEAREHVLKGLMIALDNLDAVIALIRASKTPAKAKEGLMETFGLTAVQAQAILDLRLQRLTGLEMLELRKEHAALLKLIAQYQGILASPKKLTALIIGEMRAIQEAYPSPRRTKFMGELTEEPVYTEEAVPEDMAVLYTPAGMIKRFSPKVLEKAEPADVQGTLIITKSDRKLLFFTDLGNAYPVSPAQVPECKLKDRGLAIQGLLAGLEGSEQVIRILETHADIQKSQEQLLFFTRLGMIKVTNLSEYGVRKAKFQAMGLRGDDRLFQVDVLEGDKSIFVVSEKGMLLHLLDSFNPQGRTAGGVKGMALEVGDALLFAGQMEAVGELLMISDRGYMKRGLAADFTPQKRATKGAIAFQFQKNGANGTRLVCALPVREPFALEIVQKSGMVTPMTTEEIAIQPKASKGKPGVLVLGDDVVVRVNAGDKL